jgi:hypothetical protein
VAFVGPKWYAHIVLFDSLCRLLLATKGWPGQLILFYRCCCRSLVIVVVIAAARAFQWSKNIAAFVGPK